MNPLIDLIEHPDDTVRLLALSAVEAAAYPADAVLPLLVLADRLAELGDLEREGRARTLARVLGAAPGRSPGFGRITAENAFDYLAPPDVVTAAAVAILTTPVPAPHSHNLAARSTLLAAVGVHRRQAAWILNVLDTVSHHKRDRDHLPHGHARLHRAGLLLLNRHPDAHPAPVAVEVAGQCVLAEGRFVGKPSNGRAITAAWNRIGWCCAAVAGLEPGELAKRARSDAAERRREIREIERRLNRSSRWIGGY